MDRAGKPLPENKQVVAVNIAGRIALLRDGSTVEITNLLDLEGEDCGSDEAVGIVVKIADDCWVPLLLGDYENVKSH